MHKRETQRPERTWGFRTIRWDNGFSQWSGNYCIKTGKEDFCRWSSSLPFHLTLNRSKYFKFYQLKHFRRLDEIMGFLNDQGFMILNRERKIFASEVQIYPFILHWIEVCILLFIWNRSIVRIRCCITYI